MARVRVQALEKRFEGTPVLKGVDLVVEEGELVTLLGPSGCGKTTTLRCVAGLERPDGGEVHIGDKLVVSAERRLFVPPNRRGVGMVFQSYALWPHMTVFSNVAYPLRVRGVRRRDLEAPVAEALASVGMTAYADRPVTALSGGQQQRVAVARALVGKPRILLFDEPLSNLDARLRVEIRKELRALHERTGTTSLYVTHDQEEAVALSDRIVVMREGRIEQVGSPRDIHRRPATRFVAEFVGFENLLEGNLAEVRDGVAGVALAGADAVVRGAYRGAAGAGRPVLVGVRARDVRLRLADPARHGTLGSTCGVVESRTYAGDEEELSVAVGKLKVLARRAERREQEDLAVGSRVVVDLPDEHTVVLDGEPQAQA